jgi:D-alanyl-D-alanine carboxypeptidase
MSGESRFTLGSLGKFLLCVSALESFVTRRLDCTASLDTYLPELRDTPMGRSVALSHLMSHTSGCYHEVQDLGETCDFNADWARLVRRSVAARQLFAPGTAFSYDTPNYVLCGEILRRVHGMAPRDLIRTRVLDPLGIQYSTDRSEDRNGGFVEGHTPTTQGGFEPAEPAEVTELWESASSNMTLSMPDLAKIAEAIMAAPGTAGAILSSAAQAMLFAQCVQLPIAPEWPIRDCALMSYGLGCGRHRNGLLGHPGESSGQCSALHFDPQQRIAVAVGVNARAFHVREVALTMLMRSMGCSNDAAVARRETFERGELLGDYVGGSMGRVVEVREHDGGLVCRFVTPQGADGGAADVKFPVVRFHLTDEGHAELDEQWRQIPMCFFREPGGTTPAVFAGAVSYRRVHERFD